jgi:RimJ/RimL family protein N-acetyltransferase
MELETARLQLREMRADDAESLLAVFGDPRVMAAFGVEPFERARMDAWVARNLEHQVRHGYGLFSIVLKESRVVIGDCGLERLEIGVELGYDLRSDYWNRGLATEAAIAVRDHAFDVLAIPRIVSLIRTGNWASRRVAEKVGMALAEETERDGVEYWIYALDRHREARRAG